MGPQKGLFGPKRVKSTTELGERQKEVLKRVSGGVKIPIGPNRKNGSCRRALERVKRTYIMKY